MAEARTTLVTVARDAKVQAEFNPAKVESWRLLEYEKRALAAADSNDDAKDPRGWRAEFLTRVEKARGLIGGPL